MWKEVYNFAVSTFMRKSLLILVAIALLCVLRPSEASAQATDSVAPAPGRLNIVQKVIRYFDETNKPREMKRFDLSFIGGPFYSTDTKLGIGLVGSALYRHSMADTVTQPSTMSLKLQLSTTLFYSLGLEGVHIFTGDHDRINYDLNFESFPTYFWGVGYDAGRNDAAKSKFIQRRISFKADYLHRLGRNIFIGPLVEVDWTDATHREAPLGVWTGRQRSVAAIGAGFRATLDTRDVITEPHSGWYLAFSQKFYPRFFGNSSHWFSSTGFEAARYAQVWKGGVIAGKLSGLFTYGHTPWTMMATFGGSSTMRGYYEGRYRDKCAADLTVELRQHVWRRSGIAVWAGAGTVFPEVKDLRWYKVLPNAGVGYRFQFKQRVNVRVDVGVGRGTWGVEFNINEAF